MNFFNPQQLERIELEEHLDVPIVSADAIIGKVTIDKKWHEIHHIPELSESELERLKRHARRFAHAIQAVRRADSISLQLDDLADAVLEACNPLSAMFLG